MNGYVMLEIRHQMEWLESKTTGDQYLLWSLLGRKQSCCEKNTTKHLSHTRTAVAAQCRRPPSTVQRWQIANFHAQKSPIAERCPRRAPATTRRCGEQPGSSSQLPLISWLHDIANVVWAAERPVCLTEGGAHSWRHRRPPARRARSDGDLDTVRCSRRRQAGRCAPRLQRRSSPSRFIRWTTWWRRGRYSPRHC